MSQAIDRISEWIASDDRQCRYVVTPNVDHIVMLHASTAFREAYRSAALWWPTVGRSSRHLGYLAARCPNASRDPI